jgi:hypothetical protein
MRNILLIGSSKAIKKLINIKFKNNNKISYISFRKSWENKVISKFDIIIVSGFHFEITLMKQKNLNHYIDNYYLYLEFLSKNCKQIYLISTDIIIEKSYSRVVYFYFLIAKKIKNYKLKINILCLNSLLDKKTDKLKIFIYKVFKKKFHTDYLINENIDKYLLRKLNYINFSFIFIQRLRFFDRLIRIFDK